MLLIHYSATGKAHECFRQVDRYIGSDEMDDALLWENVGSEAGPEIPLFRIRFDLMRHPGSAETFKRLVLESADWVNVVAVTEDGRIVMVTQYRFGIGQLTTEPVAGIIDPGEHSLDAAKRELLEETGFGQGRWRYLGSVQANPGFQNNLCHHWLAEDVVAIEGASPDPGEAIRVDLMTLDDVKAAIAAGAIKHPLGLSALSRVYCLWDYPFTPGTT